MVDPYDMLHEIKCETPQCGQVIRHSIRDLTQMDKVFCPKCGATIDIGESKRSGEIFRAIDAASEIAKQPNEKD